MEKKGVNIFVLLILFSIFSISLVSAIGDWKQFGKDSSLSEYQPYSIPKNYTSSTSVSVPAMDDMLVVLNDNFDEGENYNAIQDYVIDVGSQRYLVAFVNVSDNRQIRLYKIQDKSFLLQDTETLPVLSVFATATYDIDNDGNTEIIVYQDNRNDAIAGFVHSNISIWGISGGSLVLKKSFVTGLDDFLFSNPNRTKTSPTSNLLCSDFLGGSCLIISSAISNSNSETYFLFNYSYSSPKDNLMANFTRDTSGFARVSSPVASAVVSGSPRISYADVMGDSTKEIIFTLMKVSGYDSMGDAQLIILSEGGINLKKFSVVNNLTFTGDNNFNSEVYHYETITKADDMDNDGENEIVVGINTGLQKGIINISSYAIADRSGSKIISLDDYDTTGLNVSSLSYLSHFFTAMQEHNLYCPSPLDFTLFDFQGDSQKEIVITSNEYIGNMSAISVGDCRDYFENTTFSLLIRNFSNTGSYFFTQTPLDNLRRGSYGYQTIFDNNVVATETGVFWADDRISFPHQFSREDMSINYYSPCEFRATQIVAGNPYNSLFCPRTIYADVDNDGYIEAITQNSTSLTLNTFIGTAGTTNQPPAITSLTFTTGNPVCFGSSSTYNVNYTDNEADTIYIRADCFGNGSYTNWGSNSANPSVSCNYSTIGNVDTGICITDLAHYPDSASCVNHSVEVTYTNCFETGQGGGTSVFQFSNGTAGYNEFGINPNLYQKGTPTYVSKYGFDWSRCQGYTYTYGLCPLKIWAMALLGMLWAWIFANFWAFILIILIVILIAFIKRSMTR